MTTPFVMTRPAGPRHSRRRKASGAPGVALVALASFAPLAALAEPQQNALRPAGVQAAHILALWNLTLVVCGIVFTAVVLAALVALVRRGRRGLHGAAPPDLTPLANPEPRTRRVVVSLSLVSVVVLVGLIVADVATDRALSDLPVDRPLRIELTGEQWWWQAVYAGEGGRPAFVTANELHVPVGRPVVVSLKAGDVIHSFWVPNLHGKKDMLPGLDSTIEFRADQAGAYRGQCAQFCGAEHALMAMLVVADAPAHYAAWADHQAAPARSNALADAVAQRGRDVFESATCAGCHTVRGTSAQGALGPDLTHLMSRQTLAAGVLANTPGNLADWIRNPQAVKPGTLMPTVALSDTDLHALVQWLGTLQ
ncbi:c-type cytochrome [Paraburkholderia mimosarum]|uniref:cytochrome c oxidase subunit II n=1 Tax=Paraburkholderia mimosarum TaxID=312026 RepID=UPI0039C2DF13